MELQTDTFQREHPGFTSLLYRGSGACVAVACVALACGAHSSLSLHPLPCPPFRAALWFFYTMARAGRSARAHAYAEHSVWAVRHVASGGWAGTGVRATLRMH